MSTKVPRLNVVLEPGVYVAIEKLSKKEGLSMSMMARDLLREALTIYEDAYWSQEANSREQSLRHRKPLSHKQVWNS